MARGVIVEDITNPIGPGTNTRAVRTTSASDDPALTQAVTVQELLRTMIIEQKITNLFLAQAFGFLDDIDRLRADFGKEI